LALVRLADAGFVVGNQMVLLRGINDDAADRRDAQPLAAAPALSPVLHPAVRPGRRHGAPAHAGARGREILDALRGRVSGLGVPQLVVDLPGGGGKVTLVPIAWCVATARHMVFRNVEGREFTYVDAPMGEAPRGRAAAPAALPAPGNPGA
jgi:lysine 2,3-aminomutase